MTTLTILREMRTILEAIKMDLEHINISNLDYKKIRKKYKTMVLDPKPNATLSTINHFQKNINQTGQGDELRNNVMNF